MGTSILHGSLFVKNCPVNIIQTEATFMVARLVDTDLWYYGLYDTHEFALKVAEKLGNGIVFEVDSERD